MSEKWTLIVKTSLPDVCYDNRTLVPTTTIFESFDDAKAAFREKVREYAFAENVMFNGKGEIKTMNDFIEDMWIPDPEEAEFFYGDEKWLSKEKMILIRDALKEAFSGKDVTLSLKAGRCTDDTYVTVTVGKNESLSIRGSHEGPCNGINPVLKTNIFSMAEEKNYYLYIDDAFGKKNNEASAELYIDLVKEQ